MTFLQRIRFIYRNIRLNYLIWKCERSHKKWMKECRKFKKIKDAINREEVYYDD